VEVASDFNASFLAQANQKFEHQIEVITEENEDGSIQICTDSRKPSTTRVKKLVKFAKVHPFTPEE
jgi:hypothetical protein